MSSNALQQFAGGLFISSAVLGGVYWLSSSNEVPPVSEQEPLSHEQMKYELESEGFAVIPLSELHQLREAASPEVSLEEEEEITEEESIYIFQLEITAGMTSYDVADRLLTGRVITDRSEFLHSVDTLEKSTSLKIGTYQLRSDMSHEEILNIIS
ncbi:hypothetical protein [Halalkalibacter akibai]|uniref:Endolytic transglycosylase MltG n=1 Tax=Halalkalibacter akibai (strain ATCC 43226 / DSM 21942 / CIP 109018 / JCM 9157 / 1139) TaxID=1236973 RepID=W4QNJ0_HALA3|nr:hypothetical protein [Halalkalibacter akibai]GAE33447.1 hypothetical protein JCM9157_450 [Halalkalibacter akibai JCM 9157]